MHRTSGRQEKGVTDTVKVHVEQVLGVTYISQRTFKGVQRYEKMPEEKTIHAKERLSTSQSITKRYIAHGVFWRDMQKVLSTDKQ